MSDIFILVAALFVGLVSLSARPRSTRKKHPIFADENPPHVPTSPDQLHHDERRNAYLSRLNQWYNNLAEDERAEFDKKLAEKLSAYSKARTTLPETQK